MDIKKLNEKLTTIVNETQIEHVDLLTKVLNHSYDLDGPTLAEIIVPNIDDVTVEQLVDILNDYHEYIGYDQSLLPSGYDSSLGPYPAKLAEAVAKYNDREVITDIYNVYYDSKDEETFREAMKVWENAIMENPQETLDNLKVIGGMEDDATQDAKILTALVHNHLKLVDFLLKELYNNDEELADAIKDKMDN